MKTRTSEVDYSPSFSTLKFCGWWRLCQM